MRTTLTALALTLSVAVAHAGPKQEAKKHVDRAMKAHAAGKFDVALSELRAAYKLDPQPDLLYALGQVYSKLGRCTDATAEFEKFRTAKKKDPQVGKVVDEAIAACHPSDSPFADSSASEKSGSAASDTKPDAIAAEPTRSAPDEPPPATATPPAPPPAPPAAPPAPAPAPPAPTASTAPTPIASSPGSDEPSLGAAPSAHGSRAWYRDVLGDVLVAGGVVALVGAGIEYSAARSSLDDAEHAPSLASYNSLVDDAHGQRNVSLVLGVGGVALVGVGVWRFVSHHRGTEARGVAVVPTVGGGLITWGGSL